jgi:hypothetical protein
MTLADTTHQTAAKRLQMGGWRRLLVMGMMTLVVAFTFAVAPSVQVPAAPEGNPIAVNMPLENGKLPTDRSDYGLIEHGIHCLGHAVVRGEPTVSEPFRIGKEVHYATGQGVVASYEPDPS